MTFVGQLVRSRVLSLSFAIAIGIMMADRAVAHGPFDNSSLVLVRDETIEVVVTMGMDGSRQFLALAGLSEADSANALANRGPSTSAALSVELAPKFFDVESAGETLKARSVSVMNDGLEAAFTIIYPRPATSSLRLRAIYFNGIEMMTRGSLIATDENHDTLGAAMLSRANASVEVQLVVATPAKAAIVEATKQELPVPLTTDVSTNNDGLSATPVRRDASSTFIWISALLLAMTLFWMAARRSRRSD